MGMDLGDLDGRRLKKSEVKELLSDTNWVLDESLTKFFGEAKTYIHPDNNYVLSVDWNEKGGMLFLDKAAVYLLVADPNTLRSRHMLEGIFKYGEDFPENSEALSKIFKEEYLSKIHKSVNGYSIESLRYIDEYLLKYGAKNLLRKNSFTELLAYIGECVRKNYSMDWKMIKVKDNLWEPWLIDEKSNIYPIFATIYKELYEYQKGYSSIYGVVLGEIQKYKLYQKE
jgi:hypothetical protein